LRFGVEAVAMPPNPRPVRRDSVCLVVVVYVEVVVEDISN